MTFFGRIFVTQTHSGFFCDLKALSYFGNNVCESPALLGYDELRLKEPW